LTQPDPANGLGGGAQGGGGGGVGFVGEEDQFHEDSDAEDGDDYVPDPDGRDIPFEPTMPGARGRAVGGGNLDSWRAPDAHHLDGALQSPFHHHKYTPPPAFVPWARC